MLNVIWTLKACMLLLFARISSGTTHIKWIKLVAIYVSVGWVSVQIAFFTACMPFSGYWAVPVLNPQCTTLQHYAIVQAVFNLSSDVLIIAVPIPMVVSLTLPIKQRIGLGILFSMGLFVVSWSTNITLPPTDKAKIIAAILTKVHNLSNVYDSAYMLWYTREASVALYVANLPSIWPMAREYIRFFRDHTNSYFTGDSHVPRYGYISDCSNVSEQPRSHTRNTNTNVEPDNLELRESYKRLGGRPLARLSICQVISPDPQRPVSIATRGLSMISVAEGREA